MKAAYQVDGIYINRIDTATQKQIPFFAFSLVDISTEWRRVGVWYVILASLHNGFIQAIYPALDYQVTIGTVEAVNSKEEKKVGFFKRVIENWVNQEKRRKRE